MFSLGLSAADQVAFTRGLLTNHDLKVEVWVMNMEADVLSDISDMLQDGQVNVDGAAEVSRSASLSLLDPRRTLPFDTNTPTDGALFLDRMIRINYLVRSAEGLNDWVRVPIFTGPITSMSRSDANVNIELMGKEILAQRPAWRTRNYAIGSYRRSVLRELMENIGEDKLSLVEWDLKTADPYGVTRETDVWSLAKRMAAGHMMLYYDGAGWLQMRPWLARSVFTFSTGDGGSVVSFPEISYDTADVRNIVWVQGGVPKGAKYPVQYTAYAPATHPLSAQSLGRNGYARHIPEKIEDTSLLTVAACKALAEANLKKMLLGSLTASFDAMPIPHLDFGDVVGLSTPEFSYTWTLDQFSLPLKAGNTMSLGETQRRSVVKSRIRGK